MNIIYLRVSTEEQNTENQKKEVLSLVPVGEKYLIFEENKSAFKDDFKREEFNMILDLIRKGNIQKFIVWDLDRIYRNRSKLKDFFELCRLKNTKVLSVRQDWLMNLDTKNESVNGLLQDIFLNFLGWLAEEESLKKSERVKIAYQNHKGKSWGRPKTEIDYKTKLLIQKDLQDYVSIRMIVQKYNIKKHIIEKIKKETLFTNNLNI